MGLVSDNGNGTLSNIAKRISSVASDTVTVRLGTIVSDSADPSKTLVTLDNDPSQTPIAGLGLNFAYPKGTRVACLAYPPRGMLVMGAIASDSGQPTDTGWLLVGNDGGATSFLNSWSNYSAIDSQWTDASYRRIGSQVFLRGLVRAGTVGTAVFTLPTGFRPVKSHLLGGGTNGGALSLTAVPGTINGGVFSGGTNLSPHTSATQVPAGATPNHTHVVPSHQHSIAGLGLTVTGSTSSVPAGDTRFDIYANGNVTHIAGSNTYFWLDGHFFID